MRDKGIFIIISIILSIIVLIGVYVMSMRQFYPGKTPDSKIDQKIQLNQNTIPQPKNDRPILISSPQKKAKITSPLFVTGSARGLWYFEASFPIKLLDAKGNTIAQTTAHASGDWMTEQFVPFTAMLTFTTPSTSTGTLRLIKDNPSGLPEKDDQENIPISF